MRWRRETWVGVGSISVKIIECFLTIPYNGEGSVDMMALQDILCQALVSRIIFDDENIEGLRQQEGAKRLAKIKFYGNCSSGSAVSWTSSNKEKPCRGDWI